MMKIALVIAFRDFKDEEYFIPKQLLETAGFLVDTLSDSLGTALGVSGGEAKVDFVVKDVDSEKYTAIIFIGGPGSLKHLDNEDSYKLARQAKVLGAICIAPIILAKAGLLSGKKATIWTSNIDKSTTKMLNGARYVDEKVVIDGNIITASGPESAKDFAEGIIKILQK